MFGLYNTLSEAAKHVLSNFLKPVKGKLKKNWIFFEFLFFNEVSIIFSF